MASRCPSTRWTRTAGRRSDRRSAGAGGSASTCRTSGWCGPRRCRRRTGPPRWRCARPRSSTPTSPSPSRWAPRWSRAPSRRPPSVPATRCWSPGRARISPRWPPSWRPTRCGRPGSRGWPEPERSATSTSAGPARQLLERLRLVPAAADPAEHVAPHLAALGCRPGDRIADRVDAAVATGLGPTVSHPAIDARSVARLRSSRAMVATGEGPEDEPARRGPGEEGGPAGRRPARRPAAHVRGRGGQPRAPGGPTRDRRPSGPTSTAPAPSSKPRSSSSAPSSTPATDPRAADRRGRGLQRRRGGRTRRSARIWRRGWRRCRRPRTGRSRRCSRAELGARPSRVSWTTIDGDLGPRLAAELARLREAGHHLPAVAGAPLELAAPELEPARVGLPAEHVAVDPAHEAARR